MVNAFLMSALARQYLVLGNQFAERYSNAWLVWEPGRWAAPKAGGVLVDTIVPVGGSSPSTPHAGDALCFLLPSVDPRDGFTIGRSGENAIIINDATVSRRDVTLRRDPSGRWTAEAASESRAVICEGAALKVGEGVAIPHGASLQLGDVVLTLQDSAAFVRRVAKAAQELAAVSSQRARPH
jgi:hypothetical protein